MRLVPCACAWQAGAVKPSIALKVIAILWIVWGVVHVFAGVMTLGQDTPGAVQGIADGVDAALLQGPFPAAVGGIIRQHGFNLLWIGLVTTVGGGLIWRGSFTALWLSALVGGLTDLGYFIFIDLGGFNNFMPGTVMTLVSGTAIVLSLVVYFRR